MSTGRRFTEETAQSKPQFLQNINGDSSTETYEWVYRKQEPTTNNI